MITIFALFIGLTVQASFPTFQTCNHEANFGKTEVNGTKIVGGVSANENQWPFIARLTAKWSARSCECEVIHECVVVTLVASDTRYHVREEVTVAQSYLEFVSLTSDESVRERRKPKAYQDRGKRRLRQCRRAC